MVNGAKPWTVVTRASPMLDVHTGTCRETSQHERTSSLPPSSPPPPPLLYIPLLPHPARHRFRLCTISIRSTSNHRGKSWRSKLLNPRPPTIPQASRLPSSIWTALPAQTWKFPRINLLIWELSISRSCRKPGFRRQSPVSLVAVKCSEHVSMTEPRPQDPVQRLPVELQEQGDRSQHPGQV